MPRTAQARKLRDTIEDNLASLTSAMEEAQDNAEQLVALDEDGYVSYLEGDAYEIETRADVLTQNIRALASLVEQEIEDEADESVEGDGPPLLKAKFNI